MQSFSDKHRLQREGLHLDLSKFLPFEQEIRAGNEMPPRKQVLRGNQSEEASLQPFLNLNIYN